MKLVRDLRNEWGHMDKFLAMLAEENIHISRSSTAQTASFNTVSRVMTIPAFALDDKDVFLTMTSHEVAHALWTPTDWYKSHNVDDLVLSNYKRIVQTCTNIVEDIRIERLIRRRYPGFVEIYNRGYAKLLGDDFFSIDRWADFKIHDRINAYAKLGKLLSHDLSSRDLCVYKYTSSAKTFDDVIVRAEYLARLLIAEHEKCNSTGDGDGLANKNANAGDEESSQYMDPDDSGDSLQELLDEMRDLGMSQDDIDEMSSLIDDDSPTTPDDDGTTPYDDGTPDDGTPPNSNPDMTNIDPSEFASEVDKRIDDSVNDNHMEDTKIHEYIIPNNDDALVSAWENGPKGTGETSAKAHKLFDFM